MTLSEQVAALQKSRDAVVLAIADTRRAQARFAECGCSSGELSAMQNRIELLQVVADDISEVIYHMLVC
jgi:hypothetical protein